MRGSAIAGIAVSLVTLVGLLASSPAGAQQGTGRESGVSAVLLKANDGCNVDQAWAMLNSDWSTYGSVPVTITTGGDLCSGHFTLADLDASGADTVIVADTAWGHQWRPTEISALQQYVEQGHTLVGLGTDFMWHQHDDDALAPLLGLAEQPDGWLSARAGGPDQPKYKLALDNPVAPVLFRNVPDPYPSSTAGIWVQRPHDNIWNRYALAGATYVALNKKRKSAITEYDGPGYHAIYIASAAWYFPTAADLQFLYNAVIYPQPGG